ncbi:MAG: hypothetical protein KDA63_10985 [Planctomycetales bacterium]|nr:hypothetical protein [Planctomycetales bacterium]
MSTSDVFPGTDGLLAEPFTVPHTDGNIEIVREFDGSEISVALFDFDGTISDERVGWPNLAVANNVAYLMALSSPHVDHRHAEEMVLAELEATIGVPTYVQMKRLAEMIVDYGYEGPELDPQMFKNSYNDALVGMVASRRAKLATGELTMDDLRINGAVQLLEELAPRLSRGIYLASGSDLSAVTESVEHLGYGTYFPQERIMAAGSLGPEDDAKEAIIGHLLDEVGVRGEELLTFGDGFPEMLYTYRAGGVAVGVLSRDESHYEHLGHFTVAQKRERLINAGAHVLVHAPFDNVPALLDVVFTGYRVKAAMRDDAATGAATR